MEKYFKIPEKTLAQILAVLQELPYKNSAPTVELIKSTIEEIPQEELPKAKLPKKGK